MIDGILFFMESGICVIVSRLQWKVEWVDGKPIIRDTRRICLHDPMRPDKCTMHCRVDEKTMTVSDYLEQEANREAEIFNPESDVLSARCFEPMVPVLDEESFAAVKLAIESIVASGPDESEEIQAEIQSKPRSNYDPNMN